MLRQVRRLVNFIYPPRCYSCENRVLQPNTICNSCYNSLQAVGDNCCRGCGFSFLNYSTNNTFFNNAEDKLCFACIAEPRIFDSFWYLYIYNPVLFNLINRFKHKDDVNMQHYLANLLQLIDSIDKLLMHIDLIIPVPISYKKLFKRKYNHSALLGKQFSIKNKKEYNPFILKKIKHTQDQMGLSGVARLNNVKGAFAVDKRYFKSIEGCNILLIDDVVTTGSTVHECSKVLKKHKAKSVHILCLTRVDGELKI